MKIDGRKIRDEQVEEIEEKLRGKSVCFIQFGENPVAKKFVEAKQLLAQKLGIKTTYLISSPVRTEDAISIIKEASQNVDGIVVQLPLPSHLDIERILSSIDPSLDIDLLNPETIAHFKAGETSMTPPVARAVWTIFEKEKISLVEKKIVILGKGRLVGEPLAALFDLHGLSYQIFSRKDPKEEIHSALLTADVIISGIGVPGFVKPALIKEGVILIDAGTSEEANKTVGDIDPPCYEKASLYTPVPGGIGPLTVVSLFQNLLSN